jgi:chemotaxis protein CheZ
MPTPRAVFRIAEYFAIDDACPQEQILEGAGGDASPAQHGNPAPLPQPELALMHQAISMTRQEIAALQTQFGKRGQGGAGREIDAVIDTTKNATQNILQSAEVIEDLARSLAASLRLPQERDMVRDILDHVTHIFESCNFQDVTGQYLTQAIAKFKFVEDRVSRMSEIWDDIEAGAATPRVAAASDSANDLLNGPKLEGEAGHVSQNDIDLLFSAASG